jgi:hypothetical protein
MQDSANPAERPVWIRGPQLRRRWGGVPVSTYYDWLSKGKIPAARYPFGPHTPFWLLAEIEEFERNAGREAA